MPVDPYAFLTPAFNPANPYPLRRRRYGYTSPLGALSDDISPADEQQPRPSASLPPPPSDNSPLPRPTTSTYPPPTPSAPSVPVTTDQWHPPMVAPPSLPLIRPKEPLPTVPNVPVADLPRMPSPAPRATPLPTRPTLDPYNQGELDYLYSQARRDATGEPIFNERGDLQIRRGWKDIARSAFTGFALGGVPGAIMGAGMRLAAPQLAARLEYDIGPGRRLAQDVEREREEALYGQKLAVGDANLRRIDADILTEQARQRNLEAETKLHLLKPSAWEPLTGSEGQYLYQPYTSQTKPSGYTAPPKASALPRLPAPSWEWMKHRSTGQVQPVDRNAPDFNPLAWEPYEKPEKARPLTMNEALAQAAEEDIGPDSPTGSVDEIALSSFNDPKMQQAMWERLTPRQQYMLTPRPPEQIQFLADETESQYAARRAEAEQRWEGIQKETMQKVLAATQRTRHDKARQKMAEQNRGATTPTKPTPSGTDSLDAEMMAHIRNNPQWAVQTLRGATNPTTGKPYTEAEIQAILRQAGATR